MRNLPQSLIVNEVTTSGRDKVPPLQLPSASAWHKTRLAVEGVAHSAACPLTNAAAMKHAGRGEGEEVAG